MIQLLIVIFIFNRLGMSSIPVIKVIDSKALDEYFIVKPRLLKKYSSTKQLEVSTPINRDIPSFNLTPTSTGEFLDCKHLYQAKSI